MIWFLEKLWKQKIINLLSFLRSRVTLILSSRALSRVIGLVIISLIGINFGLAEVGIFALFQTKAFFLATLIKFGFSQSTYQMASRRDNNIFVNLQIFQIWSIFLVSVLIAMLSILSYYQLEILNDYALIISCAFMISWISVESAFRLPNFQPIKALAIEDIIPGLTFILLMSIFIILDIQMSLIYLYFLSLTPSMLFVLISRIKNFNYKNLDLKKDVLPIVKKNFSFFMINASQITNSHGALLLLGAISNSTFIGAYRISLAIMSIHSIVSSSFAAELQRVASKYQLSDMNKKKSQFTLINLIVSFSMLFLLVTLFNLQFLFESPSIDTILRISIMLNILLIFKAIFGFPDPILISKNEEGYISRIFILNAFMFFGISIIYITFGGASAYVVIFMVALIQPSTIIFYSKYLYKKYNIRSYINFKN